MRNDPRNKLFESYDKILKHIKLKIFVFENVMGLLSAKIGNRKTFDVIKKTCASYNLTEKNENMILNACHYGVPQIRKRIILIGIRKDINYHIDKLIKNIVKTHYSPDTPASQINGRTKYVTVRDAILDLSYLMPGDGEEKRYKVKWNDYLVHIRSKRKIYL